VTVIALFSYIDELVEEKPYRMFYHQPSEPPLSEHILLHSVYNSAGLDEAIQLSFRITDEMLMQSLCLLSLVNQARHRSRSIALGIR